VIARTGTLPSLLPARNFSKKSRTGLLYRLGLRFGSSGKNAFESSRSRAQAGVIGAASSPDAKSTQ
jgi:hypothetical protein